MNTSAFGVEKATLIRVPSTANLMIDSADRDPNLSPSPWDFQITRTNSIMNGFFTRIGTTEVVLEWKESNISGVSGLDNNQITFDISGTGANTHVGTHQVSLLEDNYTVADVLDALVKELNDISGTTGAVWSVSSATKPVSLVVTGAVAELQDSNLQEELDIPAGGFDNVFTPLLPDLRPHRYIDFVSDQLTYNQDLKDNSTAEFARDVLCRWYFSYDDQNLLDKYGFPILMGYTTFCLRRIYNPPKQIKWDASQPLGNISFKVYDENGDLLYPDGTSLSEWLMTLQFSEG